MPIPSVSLLGMGPSSNLSARRDVRRIVICGASGAGKTTIARLLAQRSRLTLIEIDALRWSAGWQLVSRDVLRHRLGAALAVDGWVVEGPCRDLCDLLSARADLILWLDYPLAVVWRRLMARAVARLVGRRAVCGGNRPSIGPQALALLSAMIRRRWARLANGESLSEAFLSRPPTRLLAGDPRVVRLVTPEQAKSFLNAWWPEEGCFARSTNTAL